MEELYEAVAGLHGAISKQPKGAYRRRYTSALISVSELFCFHYIWCSGVTAPIFSANQNSPLCHSLALATTLFHTSSIGVSGVSITLRFHLGPSFVIIKKSFYPSGFFQKKNLLVYFFSCCHLSLLALGQSTVVLFLSLSLFSLSRFLLIFQSATIWDQVLRIHLESTKGFYM